MTNDQIILHIEDNFHNRRIVRKILERHGYTMREAEDGITGFDMIQELKPPLVLLDISLPGMDGIEIAQRVKADNELEYIHLIALTASAMQGDRERFLDAGCDDYLSKPLRALDLVTIVDEYFAKLPKKEPVATAILDAREIPEPEKDAVLTKEIIPTTVELDEEADEVAMEWLEVLEAIDGPQALGEIAPVTAKLDEDTAETATLDTEEILEPEKAPELTEETIPAVVEPEEEVDEVAMEWLEVLEAKEEPKTLGEIAPVTAKLDEDTAETATLDADEILEPEKAPELTEETIPAVVEPEEEVDEVAMEWLEVLGAKEEPKTLTEIAPVTAELDEDPAETAALDPIGLLEREEEVPDEVEALLESKELKETEPQILEEDQLPEVAEELLVMEKPATASIKKKRVRSSKSIAKSESKSKKKESERAQQITANLLGMISPENINPVSPNVDIESN